MLGLQWLEPRASTCGRASADGSGTQTRGTRAPGAQKQAQVTAVDGSASIEIRRGIRGSPDGEQEAEVTTVDAPVTVQVPNTSAIKPESITSVNGVKGRQAPIGVADLLGRGHGAVAHAAVRRGQRTRDGKYVWAEKDQDAENCRQLLPSQLNTSRPVR